MLCAKDLRGERVLSFEVDRGAGPWTCLGCDQPALYRQGPHVSAHFAHKAGSSCSGCVVLLKYGGGGESLTHMELKTQIYRDALAAGIPNVHLEYRMGDTIADIALIGQRHKYAIEVQISPLKREEMESRMWTHAANGFSTLWILNPPEDLEEMTDYANRRCKYKSKALARDVHDLCNDTVFFYAGDLNFYAAHLMGYSVRSKYYKFLRKSYSLFDLVESPCEFEHWDGEGSAVGIPEGDRWWIAYYRDQKRRRLMMEGYY